MDISEPELDNKYCKLALEMRADRMIVVANVQQFIGIAFGSAPLIYFIVYFRNKLPIFLGRIGRVSLCMLYDYVVIYADITTEESRGVRVNFCRLNFRYIKDVHHGDVLNNFYLNF